MNKFPRNYPRTKEHAEELRKIKPIKIEFKTDLDKKVDDLRSCLKKVQKKVKFLLDELEKIE